MGAGVSLSARRKDGAQFPVEISLSPLQTADRLLVSAAIRDVTARRRAEEKVRALLESAPDAMVIVGSDGRIVLVNRQAELLFGYERDDLLGQPVEVLVPHRFRRRHGDHRTSYFHTPTVRPMGAGLQLYGLRRDDTQFPVEISLSPIETEEGMFVSAAIRDVTDRRVAEERLQFALERERQAMERQRELDRLKDEFLSIASHELRTPLSLILGFSEMLTRKNHLIDADKRGQLLDRIWSNASAMNRMVEQLLDYSRLEAGKVSIRPEREDLRPLVEGCVGRLKDLLRAHTLSIDVDPALTAEVDAQAFERILANLLTNAAKFTPEGGAIRVGAETHEGEVVVRVEDSGIGIPAEEQGRLFERFYQGTAAGGATRGTGIGLSIVKRYVELHGGRVWVKSQPGVGSSFFFTLPFVRTRVPER
jgi:protein-histidine pros-kinase